LGCPTNAEGVEKVAERFYEQAKASKTLEYTGEYIKLRMKVLPKAGSE
jgi:hypothetical protein